MTEAIIEGSVEVTHHKKLVEALEKHNELVEKQNEILYNIYHILKRGL